MQIEISSQKMALLIQSFLRYSEYPESAKTLQKEGGLPPVIMDRKELQKVVLDLIELGGDLYPAMQLFKRLKNKVGIEFFNEMAELEKVCSHAAENYGKSQHSVLSKIKKFHDKRGGKEKRRYNLSEAIATHVSQSNQHIQKPDRLLELVLKGLKYQKLVETGFGVPQMISNIQQESKESKDKLIYKLKQHKVFKEVHILSIAFSLDGNLLAVGTLDGFIQFWNPVTFTAAPQGLLGYDQDEFAMVHDTAVLALNFGEDKNFNQNIICSGDEGGNMNVWDIADQGTIVHQFQEIFTMPVSCIKIFSRVCEENGKKVKKSIIAAGSLSGAFKLFWLISAENLITIPAAHQSFINNLTYSKQFDKLITSSSDGTAKIWDLANLNTSKELMKIKPVLLQEGKTPSAVDYVVSDTLLHPVETIYAVLVAECMQLCVADLSRGGKVIRCFEVSDTQQAGGRFVAACFSKSAQFLYAITESAKVHIFNWSSGHLVRSFQAKDLKKVPSLLKCHNRLDYFVLVSQEDQAIQLWGT